MSSTDDVIHTGLLKALRKAGIKDEIIHAYEKTGRLVTAKNSKMLDPDELREWDDAVDEYRRANTQ